MGYTNVASTHCRISQIGLRSALNVRYSHCSKRSWTPVSSVSFSRAVNVSFNKVSVVVVFVKNTFKVQLQNTRPRLRDTEHLLPHSRSGEK